MADDLIFYDGASYLWALCVELASVTIPVPGILRWLIDFFFWKFVCTAVRGGEYTPVSSCHFTPGK